MIIRSFRSMKHVLLLIRDRVSVEGNRMNCPYCGSDNIETGVAWGKSNETGNVGLKYKTGFLGAVGVAQVYSDLCLACGSIIRSFIKEDTANEWIHKPGNFGSK